MNLDGADIEVISDHLDIDISAIAWDAKSQGLYISYDHHGNGKIAHLSLGKKLTPLAENLGGTSLGRPYGSGMFSVSNNGTSGIYSLYTRPSGRPCHRFKGQNETINEFEQSSI